MTEPRLLREAERLTKPNTSLQTYRANLGGPIVRDKAHFFVNLERVMVDRPTIDHDPLASRVQRLAGDAGPRLEHAASGSTIRSTPTTRGRSGGCATRRRRSTRSCPYLPPFAGAQNLPVTQNASREEHDVDQTVVGTSNTVLCNTRVNTVRVNFTREDVAFANPGFNGNGQDQAALKPTLRVSHLRRPADATSRRRASTTPTRSTTPCRGSSPGDGGSHDLKFGAAVPSTSRARSTAQDNLNGIFFFRTDAAVQRRASRHVSRSGCRSACRTRSNSYQKAHFGSAFAQDKWHL